MRRKEMTAGHQFDAKGNPAKIVLYDICFPDDFTLDTDPSELIFKNNRNFFEASPVIQRNLSEIRAAMMGDSSVEHFLSRVQENGSRYTLKGVLPASAEGVGYEIQPKELYEKGFGRATKPIEEIDFFHSHTLVPDVEPEVSNLFSAGDIINMGRRRIERFWVIDLEGNALCLVNPYKRPSRDVFNDPAYKYGGKFREGLTYSEALQDMMECVIDCELEIYKSTDYSTFRQFPES